MLYFEKKSLLTIGAVFLMTAVFLTILYYLKQQQILVVPAQTFDYQACTNEGGQVLPENSACDGNVIPITIRSYGSSLSYEQNSGQGGIQVTALCCIPSRETPSTGTFSLTPAPTICAQPFEVVPRLDCIQNPSCDFVIEKNPALHAVNVYSNTARGIFNFDANNLLTDEKSVSTQSASIGQVRQFTYPDKGIYDIRFQCKNEVGLAAGACTQTVTIGDALGCITPTLEATGEAPNIQVPTLTPILSETPTEAVSSTPGPSPLACFVPMPRLEFYCADGCIMPILQGNQPQ